MQRFLSSGSFHWLKSGLEICFGSGSLQVQVQQLFDNLGSDKELFFSGCRGSSGFVCHQGYNFATAGKGANAVRTC
jgi:hypothetical protein